MKKIDKILKLKSIESNLEYMDLAYTYENIIYVDDRNAGWNTPSWFYKISLESLNYKRINEIYNSYLKITKEICNKEDNNYNIKYPDKIKSLNDRIIFCRKLVS